jgi:hypothetical protein
VLFERFAADAGAPVNGQIAAFKKSRRQQIFRNVLAPFRALAFPVVSLFYKIAGQKEKCAGYQKAARHWRYYIFNAPRRRSLHHRRAREIQGMKFKFAAFESAT